MSQQQDKTKCPKCSSIMEVTEERKTKEVMVRAGNPGTGGYFGESPEEYGSGGYGDEYAMVTVTVTRRRCSKCGYRDKMEPHGGPLGGPCSFVEDTD